MIVSRVIEVSFGGGSIAYAKVDTAYFYNNGILFKPTDIDLPASYQVHWADSPQSTSTLETIGTAEGAPIPDDLWNRSRVIYGWIYLHPTEDSGVTAYEVRIYKNVRAGLPDGTEPTPAEQSTIDQLISALNSAVEQTGQDVESASQSAQSAESAKTAAESARDTAGEYANDAESSAASASTSASQASTSATASAESASASAQIKADVEELERDAQGYANSASQSASQASASEQGCARAVLDAASAAAIARARAEEASGYAQTASARAQDASGYAQTASQKATEATQSASQALGYKNDAESAKAASQTAQGLAESARDSAISAKNDAEQAKADAESARDEVQQAVASISGALIEKAPIITDTASGAIASFSDGADDLPLKSLVVDINPVQDLHGQDSPYPAGGGKNKFKYNASVGTQIINGVTWTLYEDGSIQVSGTASGVSTFRYVLAERVEDDDFYFSGNYKFYAFPANISTADFQGGVKIGSKWYSVYADGYSRALNDADGKIEEAWFQVRTDKTVNATIRPMIYPESESTPTAFAPYENICPISGWDAVGVEQRGKNLLNKNAITWTSGLRDDDGNVVPSGSHFTNAIFGFEPNTKYTIQGTIKTTGTARLYFLGADERWIERTAFIYNSPYTFTTPSNCRAIQLQVTKDIKSLDDVQVEYGSTATPYEPYSGQTITINLGQTVYGGKLDVLSGELVINRAMVDLGTLDWAYQSAIKYFYANIANPRRPQLWTAVPTWLLSDRYRTTFANATASVTYWADNSISIAPTSDIIIVTNSAFVSANDFKTAMSGAVVVYELATPIEIQLSPNQVNSLLGVNNIWADSGDTEVEYRADTKLYIARLTAPDSADMIADANITSGQYFMVGNSLYKATANIANGSAIIVGTNAVRKSLSEALNEINA